MTNETNAAPVTTAQLIAWADAADAVLATSDDFHTCAGADAVLTANFKELCRRADAGDAVAAAWLAAGRIR